MMVSKILGQILDEFSQICTIPHASAKERAICLHLKRKLRPYAEHIYRDSAGNLIAKIPPNNADANAPTVVLQAHMDMVVAGDVSPELATVHVKWDGNWLETDNRTSLGADNGIGLAVILTLLKQPHFTHGPLCILLTASEEVGLKGARRVSPDVLQAAKYLINLDGFHSDVAIIGCKGGLREHFRYHARWQVVSDNCMGFRINLEGLLGGHSGDDIDRGRCNAIRLMAAMLQRLQGRFAGMRISAFQGGISFNAIPAHCTAEAVVQAEDAADFVSAVREETKQLLFAFRDTDGGGTASLEAIGLPKLCLRRISQQNILNLLTGLANGVVQRGANGAVSASCNLGHAYMGSGRFYVEDMLRCDTRAQENELLEQHISAAKEFGFYHRFDGYHSWHSGRQHLTHLIDQVYRSQHSERAMRIETALVGIEPAYFQDKAPELEMVCLGAEIQNAHSVKERVDSQSIEELYNLVECVLYRLAKELPNPISPNHTSPIS